MTSEKINSLQEFVIWTCKIRRDPPNERRAPLSERRPLLRNEEPRLNMYVKPDARAMRACAQRANMRVEGGDLPSWMPNCWSTIFPVLPKIDGCQVEGLDG
jgi:hypothetical protein